MDDQTFVFRNRSKRLSIKAVDLSVPGHFALVGVGPAANITTEVTVGERPVFELDVLTKLHYVGEDFEANAADERHRVRVYAHHVLPVIHPTAPQFAADFACIWRATL